jgi:hypothetical protein
MTGTSVKDHDAFELQNTVGAPSGKIASRVSKIFPGEVQDLYAKLINSETFDPNRAPCFAQYLRARCSANWISFGVG